MGLFSDVGHCICRTFAGSVRVILFIGCTLLVLAGTYALISITFSHDDFRDIYEPLKYLNYIVSLLSIGTGLLGCYGAYHDHAPSIRVFLFTIVLSIVFMVGFMAIYHNSKSLKDYNDKLIKPLVSERSNYDWFHKDTSEKRLAATQKWDKLQRSAKCCGIKGPEDWEVFRPDKVSANLYPESCCLASTSTDVGPFCKREDTFLTGCEARVEQLEATLPVVALFFILFRVVLLIIGLFLLFKCCLMQEQLESLSSPRSTGFRLQVAS